MKNVMKNCTTIGKGLPKRNWQEPVFNTLKYWFAERGNRLPTEKNTAVFDFDDTCIFRDVGQAVFRYQLLTLSLRLSPDDFSALFPKDVGPIEGIGAELIFLQLNALYRKLFIAVRRDREEICRLTEYQQFIVLLVWFVRAARNHPDLGHAYSLSLMTRMLAGHSAAEVRLLTRSALDFAQMIPLFSMNQSVDVGGGIGYLQVEHHNGLRVFPEMVDLMACFNRCGVRCCVVSASSQWIVEAAVEYFGFPVTRKDIYGIRVQRDDAGKLTTDMATNYPVTYRKGKQWVIEHLIQDTPVFVAGDADTDYEMLTMQGIPMRLILHHDKQGKIRELYHDPRFLVQPVDRQRGVFKSWQGEAPEESPELTGAIENLLVAG